jgi:pimeloyl-ACP methyl ester carboxylesterase
MTEHSPDPQAHASVTPNPVGHTPPASNSVWRNLLIAIPTTLVLAYGGISIYAAHTLSLPKRNFNPESVNAFKQRPLELKLRSRDGVEIAGWFLDAPASPVSATTDTSGNNQPPNRSKTKVILLVHGMNSSRSREFNNRFTEFAAALQQRGFAVMMIDLRGHGQSGDGRLTFGTNESQDVLAAVQWLRDQGFAQGKIGVLGVSMGASSALSAAAQTQDISAVVVDSAYSEVYSMIADHWTEASHLPMIFLPSTLFFANWFTGQEIAGAKPVDRLAQYSPRPLLIIHSAIEQYTPVRHALALKAAYPRAAYWETQEPKHAKNYNYNPEEYIRRVATFFDQHL